MSPATETHSVTSDSLVQDWLDARKDPPQSGFLGILTIRETAGFLLWDARRRLESDPVWEAIDIAASGFVSAPVEAKPFWREVAALLHQAIGGEVVV